MRRTITEIFISNLMVVIFLIPMIMILNNVMILVPSPELWIVSGIVLLGLLSIIQYKIENKNEDS